MTFAFSREPLSVYDGEVAIKLEAERDATELTLVYQAWDDTRSSQSSLIPYPACVPDSEQASGPSSCAGSTRSTLLTCPAEGRR